MIQDRHAVNVLFTEEEYAALATEAAELTLQEGQWISLADLVRRRSLPQEMETPPVGSLKSRMRLQIKSLGRANKQESYL